MKYATQQTTKILEKGCGEEDKKVEIRLGYSLNIRKNGILTSENGH